MELSNSNASFFIPDEKLTKQQALARTTHLAIGAHQDDLEFMAYHGILECFYRSKKWFSGITCTNGGGSSRTGEYETFTDLDMQHLRKEEQEQAATVGRYSFMAQLGYPSSEVKDSSRTSLKEDIKMILAASQPDYIYTHNLADKHDTHIGVVMSTIKALREIPSDQLPKAVYGCEVWRGLDWMMDDQKVAQNVGGHDHLAAALNGIFESQIAGGKRYDLAVQGRRLANATFFDSHSIDSADQISFAMDLTPLITNPDLDIVEYVQMHINDFLVDVTNKVRQHLT